MIKRCSKCKEQKELDLFSNDRNGTFGKTAWCKPCVSIYVQEYKERRKKEGVKKHVASKVCARCHMEKPRSAYGKRTVSPDGLHVYCKPCQRVLQNKSRYGKL